MYYSQNKSKIYSGFIKNIKFKANDKQFELEYSENLNFWLFFFNSTLLVHSYENIKKFTWRLCKKFKLKSMDKWPLSQPFNPTSY